MSEHSDREIRREMGYSAQEFRSVLPAAMRDWIVRGDGIDWTISTPSVDPLARIGIEPRPSRILGALNLPVLAVRIRLFSDDPDLRDEFMRRFERGFHRGGG